MTEKQLTPMGLTKQGWKKVDEILAKANKEQIRLIMLKCMEKLPDDQVAIKYNVNRQNELVENENN